ncbi:MAG: type II toxin-antitoxin system VapC family toxin [Terracidiphilus sp.]
MRLLLDSHILIWLMDGDARLTQEARNLIADAAVVFASTASIWELAIKASLGKLRLDIDRLATLLDAAGIGELEIARRHVIAAAGLPPHHGDPFDRLLVAQAVAEHLQFLTADPKLAAYSGLVTVV